MSKTVSSFALHAHEGMKRAITLGFPGIDENLLIAALTPTASIAETATTSSGEMSSPIPWESV